MIARRSDSLLKRLSYGLKSRVKTKHVEAFLRYSTPTRLANFVKVEAAIRQGRVKGFGYPYLLTIEPTNRCNLSCPLCPTGRGLVGRKKQSMMLGRYEQLLDEIGRYVYLINFQNWGEPMIARSTPDMIAAAHDRRIYTAIQTNGNYAAALNLDVLEAGLDHISFAVDGATQETYQEYRVGGDLEVVKENIRELLARRREAGRPGPFVEMQFLVFKHNRDDLPRIRKLGRELGVDGLLIRAAVAPDNEDNRDEYYTWDNHKAFCRRFWYTASINSDGGVTPCCNYFFSDDDLGNIQTSSFDSIWNGPEYAERRRAVAERDFDALSHICKSCKIYGGSLSEAEYGVARDDVKSPQRSERVGPTASSA